MLVIGGFHVILLRVCWHVFWALILIRSISKKNFNFRNWTVIDNVQCSIGNGQCATYKLQVTMDKLQWTMHNRQWTIDNEQWTLGNGQWTMNNIQ